MSRSERLGHRPQVGADVEDVGADHQDGGEPQDRPRELLLDQGHQPAAARQAEPRGCLLHRRGERERDQRRPHESNRNVAPTCEYVPIPAGSSSAAPVTNPGPSLRKYPNPRRPRRVGWSLDRCLRDPSLRDVTRLCCTSVRGPARFVRSPERRQRVVVRRGERPAASRGSACAPDGASDVHPVQERGPPHQDGGAVVRRAILHQGPGGISAGFGAAPGIGIPAPRSLG